MTAATEGLTHTYVPRGAARRLLECRDGEVLLCGPAGTGKSRAALEKGLMLALNNPGSAGLIVRKTMVSLTGTGLVTWNKWVIPEAKAAGLVHFYGGSKDEPAAYIFDNGSTITVGGMDKPDKIMSSEYDWAFVQEATELTLTDWESITSRLRNGVISFQQLMADCNPNVPHHWLNQRCDAGITNMLYSVHKDNPRYYTPDGVMTEQGRAYIEGKLARLTGVRRQRLYEGKWAAAEGLVYETFDPSVHIIEDIEKMPKGWEQWDRLWSVDFGYRNPFVCQFWAKSPDGALYLYREIYMTNRIVQDHAEQIMSLVRRPKPGVKDPNVGRDRDWEWLEPKPRSIVCDHDAEDRATLERYIGLSTIAADKAVKTGIEQVQDKMRVDERGKTGFYFLRDAVVERDTALVGAGKPASTLEELPGYIWPEGVKAAQRENPVKEDDHGMDAMRYVEMENAFSGPPKIRFA